MEMKPELSRQMNRDSGIGRKRSWQQTHGTILTYRVGWLYEYLGADTDMDHDFLALVRQGGKSVPIRLVYPPDIRLARYIKNR